MTMTQTAAPLPDVLTAFDDSDWNYYVPGHDPEELLQVDELENLKWEPLWLRPVRASQLDESEIDDPSDTVRRGPDGRFAPRWCWMECSESHPDATPFLGARYA